MQASSWVEQEQLDGRLAELQAHNAALGAQLQALQAELSSARAASAAQDAALRRLADQLLVEGESVARLRKQLSRERELAEAMHIQLAQVLRMHGLGMEGWERKAAKGRHTVHFIVQDNVDRGHSREHLESTIALSTL